MRRAVVARCAPFALFMAWLAVRGAAPGMLPAGFDPRWIYGVGALVVGALLVGLRRDYGELAAQTWPTARELLLAVAVGLLVFVAWIHLDAPWLRLGSASAPFDPLDAEGRIDVGLAAVRWAGAALVVPVMEELFWRSFLMRWIENARFEAVDPQRVGLRAIVLSTFVFVLAHTLWLAAIVAGLAYALLYRRTGRLWVPVIAHAVTNGTLGAWVLVTRQWTFW